MAGGDVVQHESRQVEHKYHEPEPDVRVPRRKWREILKAVNGIKRMIEDELK